MRIDKLLLVLFTLAWFALWLISRRFQWDELAYEQSKDSAIAWRWLDVFKIPKTRENCLRFMQLAWVGLLVLLSAGTIVVLIWGR
jgi:hypothetical protein